MAGLVPAIHAVKRHAGLQTVNQELRDRRVCSIKPCRPRDGVDGRNEPGHDGGRGSVDGQILAKSNQRTLVSLPRHCERSEAIQRCGEPADALVGAAVEARLSSITRRLDGFASLAMTARPDCLAP
jgi:hypothetical protein